MERIDRLLEGHQRRHGVNDRHLSVQGDHTAGHAGVVGDRAGNQPESGAAATEQRAERIEAEVAGGGGTQGDRAATEPKDIEAGATDGD